MGSTSHKVAQWTADNFGKVTTASRLGLGLGHVGLQRGWRQACSPSSRAAPGNAACRAPAKRPRPIAAAATRWCISRPAAGAFLVPTAPTKPTLPEVIMELLVRAGYAPRLPEGFDKLCCGQMLASKGMAEEADAMSRCRDASAAESGRRRPGRLLPGHHGCQHLLGAHAKDAGRSLATCWIFMSLPMTPCCRACTCTKKPGPIALHINCSVRRTGVGRQAAPRAGGLRRTGRRARGRDLLRLWRRPWLCRARTQCACAAQGARRACPQVAARVCPPTAPAKSA